MLLIIKRFFNLNKSFQNEVPANVILLAYYKNITGLYLKKKYPVNRYFKLIQIYHVNLFLNLEKQLIHTHHYFCIHSLFDMLHQLIYVVR